MGRPEGRPDGTRLGLLTQTWRSSRPHLGHLTPAQAYTPPGASRPHLGHLTWPWACPTWGTSRPTWGTSRPRAGGARGARLTCAKPEHDANGSRRPRAVIRIDSQLKRVLGGFCRVSQALGKARRPPGWHPPGAAHTDLVQLTAPPGAPHAGSGLPHLGPHVPTWGTSRQPGPSPPEASP